MTLSFLTGDATQPVGAGNKIIVHICNDIGKWGKGFVLALLKRWPVTRAQYMAWYKDDDATPFQLGEVQFVQVESDIWVANLIGQHGIRRRGSRVPIRYEAVAAGLAKVAVKAQELNASVHMPRIGCGLAGGKWEEIEPLIDNALCQQDIAVTVYDLP